MGDYVLRGLNGLRSKTYEHAFVQAPARLRADSYNGVRAGAAGGFVTVMVPDLLPADDEMRGLYTMECTSLNEVLAKLKTGEL